MSENSLIKDGQKIVFLGDSITAAPDGYVKVVGDLMAAVAPETRVTCINAGIGGNKVPDLPARIDTDAIAHDPDWITISIGVNDVWHGLNGTTIDRFRELYDELVVTLQKRTVAQLALFTTTVIGEDLECEANQKLVEYNDFIRETAAKRNALLVPMNEEFHHAISAWKRFGDGTDLRFTTDGVHMKPPGNYLMAVTLLRAWKVLEMGDIYT